ncbi:DUF4192 family protein [Microbacterium limosum]|uniref:DUF4192 family protein n=1 Tax=Microbacterium limosum TaxID=3079935 RepID=A0AAU0MI92_9MICO|nr:DUF4192 family protein [Microbacterium sp. Y20]WOQ69881.1 DUF4192 family protein [Microbacterium sp. Y20]
MQTVFKAADAADFLALVPALAGYRPVDSVALVLFRGTRTAGVIRLDLAAFRDPLSVDSAAATAVGLACKVDSVDGVAVVVYTDDPLRAGPDDLPCRDAVDAIEAKAHACGLQLVDALCVAADAWGSYLDAETPPGGWDLDRIRRREADVPFALPASGATQSDGASLPAVDLAEKERVARAHAALQDAAAALGCGVGHGRGDLAGIDPRALAIVGALDDLPAFFERSLTWAPASLDPFDAATLLWCIERPVFRDVFLTQMCGDVETGDATLADQLAWHAGEDLAEDCADALLGRGPRPEPARLTTALELMRRVAATAPRARRPGPMSAAAWLCWALGRSTQAAWFATEALRIEPEHGMATIVLTLVQNAVLPEWAFERP